MFSQTHLRLPFALSALLLLAGSSVGGCKRADATTNELKPDPAVSVTTTAVTPVDTVRTLRLTGTLRGQRETDLAANVAGRITKIDAERGQPIAKGALIAQADVKAAALALTEARVAVQVSKTQEVINQADCARYEQLKAGGAVTPLEYDQVTAKCKTAPLNREAAQARESMAAKNVGDGAIRAPFAGVITERYVEVGEYVQASSRVVSIAQVDELKLEFSLPEQNFPDVKIGAAVDFRVGAYGNEVFTGKVTRVSGAVRETRDVLVEAHVKNADNRLLPGMFADIELAVGKEALPSVPKSATFDANGKVNVLVVTGGALEQRVLQPGPAVNERVSVRRGVVLGERVVAKYEPALKNGQRVQ
jgi:membrane fusion protein, multidrug efflux system